METRALAALVVSAFNAMIATMTEFVEAVEEALAADGGDEEDDPPARASRSKKKTAAKKKTTSRRRAKVDEEEEEEEREEDEDGFPTEAALTAAVRAAMKVLERKDVAAIIRKHGKASRATEVVEERRQAVIDALEDAMSE